MAETESDSLVFPPLPSEVETTTEYAVQWSFETDPTMPERDLMEITENRRKAEQLVEMYGPMVRLVERTVTRSGWSEVKPEHDGGQR